jgi:hypothetical protein
MPDRLKADTAKTGRAIYGGKGWLIEVFSEEVSYSGAAARESGSSAGGRM